MFAKTYSDSMRAALIETALENISSMVPDDTHIEMTSYDKLHSLCLLKHIVIALAALIETALEDFALWYPDVTHIEMTS